MHTAAQGDKALIMAYLKQRNVSITEQDNNGRTPLHWACYQGGEESSLFLISWGVDLNIQDFDVKMTPLHLAVLSGSV